MATNNFTLEDIRQVVREETNLAFDQKFDEKFKPAFDAAFKPAFDAAFKPAFDTSFQAAFKPAFDAAFRPAFDDAFDPWALAIQQDFQSIHDKLAEHDDRFDRLETNVESLKTDTTEVKSEIKGIKRIVGQHSREIIELRSRVV